MGSYEEEFEKEVTYLNETISIIKRNLDNEIQKISEAKKELINTHKDMWENTVHFTDDIDRLADIKQELDIVHIQRAGYEKINEKIQRYNRMLRKPYFARIDFKEEGESAEKIYIGFSNLLDEKYYEPYVYDWRSPIASVFYRYELGEVKYKAPNGEIRGEVSLKRQYEINNGKLNYFIDSSLNIIDDVLREALSKNTSSKMKTIVETIQREQDVIIRDIESDLLIVQGVAGSGKTSIALHRVAFLMYQGLIDKINSNNIIIISPNDLFGGYISDVLPELGEDNIKTMTFENIFKEMFDDEYEISSRNNLLEKLVSLTDMNEKNRIKSSVEFKGSREFVMILNRLVWYFEHKMIEIKDIYYNGIYIEDRNSIKNFLLKDSINIPLEKKLKIIEKRLLDKIVPIRKSRREKLKNFISKYPHHQFEINSLARLTTIKESNKILDEISSFTKIDYFKLYKMLFKNKTLFYNLCKGINLPKNIEEIIETFSCEKNSLSYEDGLAIMYLKIKMSGCNIFRDIKQVVVDEAQDYYEIHYEILKELFKNSKFTILGDINQAIEKESSLSIYDEIKIILNKKRSTTVFMNKSFRCSYEISKFSSKFLDHNDIIESFERHEEVPKVIEASCMEELESMLVNYCLNYKKLDYSSVAILCKSMEEAKKLYEKLKDKVEVKILDNKNEIIKGILIMPIYISKGLEFDAVMVCNANDKNYCTEFDKRLLYIACTRALHKLELIYEGKKSKYI